MIFGYFTLFVALVISAVAAYYSIVGLTAIFSAAVIPILIMGASLEVGKVTAAVWLKLNWHRARWTYKMYLVPAVAFLMLLTSMGIFGFLSKAHSDQSLVSGDSMAKVAIYDEKIKTAKDNIDANRKALKQMDDAVDQVMGRSSDEKGADKAVAIRRGQQKERARLQSEIQAEQKTITSLSEEAAPLRAEFRKVEAEVGPIKYIAALVYGDNPDSSILEKAVRLVIIIIVAVFDPLALVLILAAQQSIKWAREEREQENTKPDAWVADVGEPPTAEEIVPAEEETPVEVNKDTQTEIPSEGEPPAQDPYPPGWMFEKHPYLNTPFVHFRDLKPMTSRIKEFEEPDYKPDDGPLPEETLEQIQVTADQDLPVGELITKEELFPQEPEILTLGIDPVERPGDYITEPVSKFPKVPETANRVKVETPPVPETLHFDKHSALEADNVEGNAVKSSFGTKFPDSAERGEMFLRVDYLPNRLYKFTGFKWIEVDKTKTDSYSYDEQYILFLIDKLQSGEYDIDQLSTSEQELVAEKLEQIKNDNT